MTAVRQAVRGAMLIALAFPFFVVSAQSVPPGWVAHYRPSAELFVPHPPGWQVQEQGKGAFVVFLPGPGGIARALVYVKPLQLGAQRRIADVLAAFPREEKALFPGARINVNPEDLTDRSVLGELRFTVKGEAYRGALLLRAGGRDRGALYVISETERAWPAHGQTMANILKGFAYMPARGSAGPRAATAMPPMQTWRDPTEGAFTVPVPQGWQVQGGVQRPGLDLRDEVVVASPDGSIQIRIGDVGVPKFIAPYAIPGIGAQAEGSTTTSGLVVMRYLPGHAFLTQFYLPRKFGPLPPLQTQVLPALAEQSYRAFPPPPPMQGRVDAGAVSFDVQTPGGPRRVWYLAVTRYQEVPGLGGSAHWWVDVLDGCLSPPGSEALAHRILAEIKRGFAVDPRWAAAELQMRGQLTQAVIDHNRSMNDSVARINDTRSQGLDRAQAQLGAGVRGEIKVQDSTGQTVVVPVTGSQDYYRVRQTGEIVASDRPDLPPFDYDRLWRVQ